MGFDLDDSENEDEDENDVPTGRVNDNSFDYEEIKDYWLEDNETREKMVCMLVGQDGTGKSGVALDYLTDEDIANGKRCLVIDLDGGVQPLVNRHHRERCNEHDRKLSDVYMVRNPLAEDDRGNIDYQKTFDNVRKGIFLAKNGWNDLNIKHIVFDGLSTALKFAENQMRLEKNVDDDEGVKLRYWLRRNKIFKELLEQIKALPISSFFIGHEDFIKTSLDEDMSSVKKRANAMMHQRLICERKDEGDQVRFSATVDKSKYKAESEGAELTFLTVNKENQEVNWDTSEVYKSLL